MACFGISLILIIFATIYNCSANEFPMPSTSPELPERNSRVEYFSGDSTHQTDIQLATVGEQQVRADISSSEPPTQEDETTENENTTILEPSIQENATENGTAEQNEASTMVNSNLTKNDDSSASDPSDQEDTTENDFRGDGLSSDISSTSDNSTQSETDSSVTLEPFTTEDTKDDDTTMTNETEDLNDEEIEQQDNPALYVIIIIVLLFFAIVILAIYLHKLRRKRNLSSGRRSSTLIGKLGRRHSHPIKVKYLPKTTSDLLASAGHLLEMEFEDLNILSEAQRADICKTALTPENKHKNRYFNILPYRHSRVLLDKMEGDPDSTYINASFVMGFNGPKEYIASQGPKSDTLEDFWRMIWEQNVRVIVMLTGLEERGKQKCDQYWPEVDKTLSFHFLDIKHVGEKTAEIFVQRTFEVQSDEISRTVHHFCFRDWPDFGCPASPEVLIKFIEIIRSTYLREPCDCANSPILVHCSAGVGRTGTFIAVDWLMQEASVSEDIDIFSTILRVRSYRMKMVQSEEQYEYIYKCLSHYVTTRILATDAEQKGDSDQEYLIGRNNSIPLIEYDLETNSSLMQDIP